MTQQEGMQASRCSSSLLATSVRKSDNPIILLFSDRGRDNIKSSIQPTYLKSHRPRNQTDTSLHLLSSIAGSTFGLMVKRFSATLVSKSTYMSQIREGLIDTFHSVIHLVATGWPIVSSSHILCTKNNEKNKCNEEAKQAKHKN